MNCLYLQQLWRVDINMPLFLSKKFLNMLILQMRKLEFKEGKCLIWGNTTCKGQSHPIFWYGTASTRSSYDVGLWYTLSHLILQTALRNRYWASCSACGWDKQPHNKVICPSLYLFLTNVPTHHPTAKNGPILWLEKLTQHDYHGIWGGSGGMP